MAVQLRAQEVPVLFLVDLNMRQGGPSIQMEDLEKVAKSYRRKHKELTGQDAVEAYLTNPVGDALYTLDRNEDPEVLKDVAMRKGVYPRVVTLREIAALLSFGFSVKQVMKRIS